MKYYKIFRQGYGWWKQDGMGYESSEHEAGFFSDSEVNLLGLDDSVLHEFKPSKLALRLRDLKHSKC